MENGNENKTEQIKEKKNCLLCKPETQVNNTKQIFTLPVLLTETSIKRVKKINKCVTGVSHILLRSTDHTITEKRDPAKTTGLICHLLTWGQTW